MRVWCITFVLVNTVRVGRICSGMSKSFSIVKYCIVIKIRVTQVPCSLTL
jgi:hypothetical protein